MYSNSMLQGSNLAFGTHAPRSQRRLAVDVRVAVAVDKTDMKQMRKPRQENVGEDFYVDHTCIDWSVVLASVCSPVWGRAAVQFTYSHDLRRLCGC